MKTTLLKNHFLLAVLIAIGLHSLNSYASNDEAELKRIGLSDPWLKLLYYKKLGQKYKSTVTTKAFFANPDLGPTDPIAELKAMVEIFQIEKPGFTSHPQCLFPARYLLLKKYFKLQQKQACENYDQWAKSYQPKSLKIVYASQYISNPASVFGHSFLLLETANQTKGFWMTFNYAASMPKGVNPLAYVWGGLTGWFEGDYSIMPLYHRIFQYGSIENRDLWLYDIKLSADELTFFLAHMWELVHTANFKYYFLDENCAGVILKTLNAVLPDMPAVEKSLFYIHPLQIIKDLQKANRLGGLELIASQSHLLSKSVDLLSPNEKKNFTKIVSKPNKNIDIVSPKSAEALIQFLDFQRKKNQGELPAKFKNLERRAFIKRSELKGATHAYEFPELIARAPHLSHDSTTLSIGGSAIEDQLSFDFGFRISIHDFIELDAGFIENSSIEFMDMNFHLKDDQLWFNDWTIFKVESFQPLVMFQPQASWRAKASLQENIFTDKLNDHYFEAQGGLGLSQKLFKHMVYVLGLYNQRGGHYEFLASQSAGPEFGMLLRFEPIKIHPSVKYDFELFNGKGQKVTHFNIESSYVIDRNLVVLQNWSMMNNQTEGKDKKSAYEFGLKLQKYF